MRRVVSLSMLGLAAVSISGCDLKQVYPTAIPPLAGVRFINAVPDTAGTYGMDLRFVDVLESNAHFRQNFRNGPVTASGVTTSAGVQYKHARAGQRRFKIFLDDTLQSIATVEIKDTTVTLVAGTNYTAILWGYANPTGPGRPAGAPAMRLTFLEETVAPPGADVAVRVINATGFPIDAEHYISGGAPTGTATWANIAPLSVTTHVTFAPSQRRFSFAATGGGATVLYGATNATNPLALVGTAASTTAPGSTVLDIEALPGTNVAGSAVSMVVFPQSVRGLARVAQHTTTVASGRRISTIEDLGGGTYRVNDCFATADCLGLGPDGPDLGTDPDTVVVTASNPNVQSGGCAPDSFGDCRLTITPAGVGAPAPITVTLTANTNGTFTTTDNLAAYVGDYRNVGVNWTLGVIGWHAGVTSIWDRRPPYANP